jgi:hypothetical protein
VTQQAFLYNAFIFGAVLFVCSHFTDVHGVTRLPGTIRPFHFSRPFLYLCLFPPKPSWSHTHSPSVKRQHYLLMMRSIIPRSQSPWKPHKNEHEAEDICPILDAVPVFLNLPWLAPLLHSPFLQMPV